MKKIILGILLEAVVCLSQGDFRDGYDEGYKAGACYQCYNCLAPISPIPPIPRIGEDTWQGGYNRGFMDGLRVNRCR